MYTKEEILSELNSELSNNISQLYQADFIKRKGKTKDGEYYTEIIAKELMSQISAFNAIEKITRVSTYKVHNHTQIGIDLDKSNRHEDIFAKRLFGLEFHELGTILDYQIPLRDTAKDKGIKAFDLLSYNQDDNCLYLIELKYLGNKEPLLRAILECYTYLKIVDHDKLIKDFLGDHSSEDVRLMPVVLLVSSKNNKCQSYVEYNEMLHEKRPMLQALSAKMKIKFTQCDLPEIFSS